MPHFVEDLLLALILVGGVILMIVVARTTEEARIMEEARTTEEVVRIMEEVADRTTTKIGMGAKIMDVTSMGDKTMIVAGVEDASQTGGGAWWWSRSWSYSITTSGCDMPDMQKVWTSS